MFFSIGDQLYQLLKPECRNHVDVRPAPTRQLLLCRQPVANKRGPRAVACASSCFPCYQYSTLFWLWGANIETVALSHQSDKITVPPLGGPLGNEQDQCSRLQRQGLWLPVHQPDQVQPGSSIRA